MPNLVKWVIALAAGVLLVFLGWRIALVLVTLHILVCLLLIFVIMLQSGSAADLAGAFGGAGSQTAFGPRGAATFLTKATTWCAIVFMMSSLALSLKRAPTTAEGSSILEQTMPTAKPAPAPVKRPVQTPPAKPAPQNPAPPHK